MERSVKALPNKDTQIAIYFNVREDCTSGPLPTIRLVIPPSSGKVVVKSANVKATNYKACLALEVPGYVSRFYRRRHVDDRSQLSGRPDRTAKNNGECRRRRGAAKNLAISDEKAQAWWVDDLDPDRSHCERENSKNYEVTFSVF
jgi:hypothetical protein